MSEFLPEQPMGDYKSPPQAIEAEQSVLGGLMIDHLAFDKLGGMLKEDDFYTMVHRHIFKHIQMLIVEQKPIDVLTVAGALESNGLLDKVGGLSYLGSLAQNVPSTANILFYAFMVREKSILRKVIQISQIMADSAYNPAGKSAKEILEFAEKSVFDISESDALGRQGFVPISPLLVNVVERVEKLYSSEDQKEITGVSTGFIDLDRMTSGLQPGDLIIVAARPSMGKTAFAINIAENVALESKLPVAIFSMEMGGEQLAMRMISSVGRLNQHTLRSGKLEDDDWPRMTHALGMLNDAPIYIDESPALNIIEIRSRARRLVRENGRLGLIVIDYLQLMATVGNKQNENRATAISEMTRALKGLAKELKVPVITLSQLNRSLEQRQDKKPMMSDLRESGAIEQDADLILFIHREEYYSKDSLDKGKAIIIVGKHRNGPTGEIPLVFINEHTRFESMARVDYRV